MIGMGLDVIIMLLFIGGLIVVFTSFPVILSKESKSGKKGGLIAISGFLMVIIGFTLLINKNNHIEELVTTNILNEIKEITSEDVVRIDNYRPPQYKADVQIGNKIYRVKLDRNYNVSTIAENNTVYYSNGVDWKN